VNRPLHSSDPAAEELTAAVRWYEARRTGLGGEFFDAVVTAVALIESRPEIGTTVSADGQTRRVLVARFPYQVVYRLRPTDIVIVAVAHLRRRPAVLEESKLIVESTQRGISAAAAHHRTAAVGGKRLLGGTMPNLPNGRAWTPARL
jgi:plasmid stabilization system protein ParE